MVLRKVLGELGWESGCVSSFSSSEVTEDPPVRPLGPRSAGLPGASPFQVTLALLRLSSLVEQNLSDL